jgi:phenylpropionate dioxygenase-like ring-hydroxylating dioxygenase large terminal subunit
MFLRNCWYVAASLDELEPAKVVARRILDKPVLLYRTGSGVYTALADRCPHRQVPLSAGSRVGDDIRCGYHGLSFGPDGRCNHIPGQVQIPATLSVATYPVESRYRYLWIWMGDAPADPALIPLVSWPTREGWAFAGGYTWFGADYRLLTDNLLDLSHENYIHGGTIGNEDEETIAMFPTRVISEDHIVRVAREMPDISPPPFFRMMTDSDSRIDRWQTAIWTAPSVNITDVGARVAGSTTGPANMSRVLHLLTPETDTTTHYFWSQSRNSRTDDQELTDAIRDALRRTFDEDKEMLEIQQTALTETGARVPGVALKVDDGPLRARRFLSGLIKREQESGGVVIEPSRPIFEDD